ncbi:MAG: AAA family ATPase [Phycisphaerales bacterium JB038]
MSADLARLEQLLRSATCCAISICTHDEEEALGHVREAAMGLKADLLVWSVTRGLREGLVSGAEMIPETEHAAAALYQISQLGAPALVAMLDLAEHLGDARTLRAWREAVDGLHRVGGTMVMIDHTESLPPVVRAHCAPMELSLPDEQELEQIVRSTLRSRHIQTPIEIDLRRSELGAILRNLRGLTRRQARRVITEAIEDDRRFDISDLDHVVARKRELVKADGLLEFVDAPADMAEIGGLGRLKSWLKARTLDLPEEALARGMRAPRGVLMLGVQGAGKSLCAKAIAAAWRRPLLRLDPGALYDKYIGESERRLRDALAQAEGMAPIILWIDEIEKGFASASGSSNDGGLSRRMFGSLLTWMQEHRSPVFIVATANDIESLPPELMRKGRFDEIFFVDLPGDEAREAILKIHLQKRQCDPDEFDLPALVKATNGYSGAEIEQGVLGALHDCFASGRTLTTDDLLTSYKESPPLSVTMREKVDALRAWARGRCMPAE